MSKHLHTVEIEGYGPVEIFSLSRRVMREIKRKAARPFAGSMEDPRLMKDLPRAERRRMRQDTLIFMAGLKSPRPPTEEALRAEFTPDQVVAITQAIRDRSWPS